MLKSSMLRPLAAVLMLGAMTACDDDLSDPNAGTTDVAVRFAAAAGPAPASIGPAGLFMSPRALSITGTNGTLVIDDIRVIVAELELDRAEDGLGCDDLPSEDSCEEFEAPPAFVDLPLDGSAVTVATAGIPDGVYDELEFEIEDLDVDDEDEDPAQIAAVANAVRAAFPAWPEDASMVVVGSFTATGGSPVSFTVYFDAEIEVELDLVPALTVADGQGDRSLTVELFLAEWFRNIDGTVVDLSQWDFDATGQTVDFDLEIESDFQSGLEVELDVDD